jgi:hypothetical protein
MYDVEGSNFRGVLTLPEVDFRRTSCNNVLEVEKVRGRVLRLVPRVPLVCQTVCVVASLRRCLESRPDVACC